MNLENILSNKLSQNGLVVEFGQKKSPNKDVFMDLLSNAKYSLENNNNTIKFEKNSEKFEKSTTNDKFDNKNTSKNTKDLGFENNKEVNKYSKSEKLKYTKKSDKSQKSDETENIDETDAQQNKVIIFDEKALTQLSQILGIEVEKIMAVLSDLSMPISALQNTENIVAFLQETLNLENPVELLAKDGIKDIVADISNLSKSINYKDVISDEKELQELAKSVINQELTDIKVANLPDSEIKGKVEFLLTELKGKVVEVNKKATLENNILNTNNTNNTKLKDLINNKQVDLEKVVMEQVPLEENLLEGTVLPKELLQKSELKEVDLEDTALSEVKTDADLTIKTNLAQNFSQSDKNFSQNQNSNFLNQEFKEILTDIKTENFNIAEINQNIKSLNVSLPKTQVLKNINSTEVISQIIEKMKVSVKQDMTEMKVLLRPEHLGEVSLKIATQNGIIVAQFTAENQKVKETIEANFNQLKDMLLEQGVEVGSLEVNVSDGGQEGFKQFENMQDQVSKKSQEIIRSLEEEKEPKEEKIKTTNSQVDYEI